MFNRNFVYALVALLPCAGAYAQQSPNGLSSTRALPPVAQTPSTGAGNPTTGDESLTRRQAEQLALANNPSISVAALLALAQRQVVREVRSAQMPTITGNVSLVGAEDGSRLSSGSLTSSRLTNHVGGGLQLSQLITDFGRTRNLTASSNLQAQASEREAQATRQDIVLATDLAFYAALEAQATLQVANSTVGARQNVADQVTALAASKLKSTLDQSFAEVNLSDAKMLVLDAQNHADAALARLNEILGQTDRKYRLVDDEMLPLPVAPSEEQVTALALQERPDLQALKLNHEADVRFSRAQHEQLLPTISALAVIGGTPVGSSAYFLQNWYGAAGVNLSVPIFNGYRFRAQADEADSRAKASSERSRQLVDQIVRDVRIAWLATNTARQRMNVTAEFVRQANTALELAQTRYRLGLSSIVEVSQAQLQQTQAQIADANARFEYEADIATLHFQSGVRQ